MKDSDGNEIITRKNTKSMIKYSVVIEMTSLPNIKLTKEEINSFLIGTTNFYGAEGKIFREIRPKEARKIFYYPISGTKEELERFYQGTENKFQKLVRIHEKRIDNGIVPTATLSYDGVIVGYDMTSPSMNHPREYNIKQLYDLKKKINKLHAQGIVHGDIKERNILINSQGEVVLCDLDNMQVDNYPIDYINYMIEYFPDEQKLVDENADIYLYNLLFLKQKYYPDKDYGEIQDEIIYEHFPPTITKKARQELQNMQTVFCSYQGNYLIDSYTKKKGAK